MKSFMILCVVLISFMALAFAAPAEQPAVQFVKYKNNEDFENIQKQIIAQYDHLGGSSQFHNVKTTYVDPQHIKINL